MNSSLLSRRFGLAAFGVCAIAIGTTLHLPAFAAAEYHNLMSPQTASSCTGSSPCLEWTNTAGGAALEGISKKGNGTIGQTAFKSTSQSNGKAGLLGQDVSASGTFDVGVLGTSLRGSGVEGTSSGANGVVALSTGNSALFAENSGVSDGAQIIALNNDGTNSSTQNPSGSFGVGRSGVWGHDDSTDGGTLNVGVAGSSTNGIGISASSSNYVALNAIGGGGNEFNDFPTLSVVTGNPGTSSFLMAACSSPVDNPCTVGSGSRVFLMDTGGNLTIKGTILTGSMCSSGCSGPNHAQSHRVLSYVPTQSVPSIDDFGEAQLVDGRATVTLSADFANVVDRHANYLVFITPEGDSHGLYVTDKTTAGFSVRENGNGHSSLAFSYRIVAKPYGVTKPRLPMEAIGHATNTRMLRHG